MDKSVILPVFVSVGLLLTRGFGPAFTYWYIPFMLIMPTYLQFDGPGIPPVTFYLMTFMPFLFRKEMITAAVDDMHWLDFIVYFYVAMVVLSEWINQDFGAGRQHLFLNVFYIIGPYLGHKYVCLRENRDIQVAMAYIVTLSVIAFINMYEFRMGQNLFLILRDMWPVYDAGFGGVAVFPRWGFFRASGPFVHAIIAGIAFGFAMPLAFWLTRSKIITPAFKGLALTGMLFLGMVMTMSRGPIIGGLLGVFLYVVGQSKLRIQLFATCIVVAMLMTVPITFKLKEYFSLTRETAQSETQETALYRRDLILNYMEYVVEKPLLGYGQMNVPVVGDQTSIDNAYILFALCWGAPASLSVFFQGALISLALFLLGNKPDLPDLERGLIWCIIGGICGCLFSIATVYLASPVNTQYYMWCAWGAAVLIRQKRGQFFLTEQKPKAESVEQSNTAAGLIKEPEMIIL